MSMKNRPKREIAAPLKNSEIEIVTTSAWRFKRIDANSVNLQRTIRQDGDLETGDAIGPHWAVALCSIEQGRVTYLHGNAVVDCPPKYAIFMPSYCGVRAKYSSVKQSAKWTIWYGREPANLPKEPLIFTPQLGNCLSGKKTCPGLSGPAEITLESAPSPALLISLYVPNEKIDRTFCENSRLSDLARSLKTTGSYLARKFRQESHCTPIQYRTQMRISTAAFELLQERAIIDVFQEVGFVDLGRFYKQFLKVQRLLRRLSHATRGQKSQEVWLTESNLTGIRAC